MVSKEARARGAVRRDLLTAALARPRDRAPSLPELAVELGCAVTTVHYHLRVLVQQGRVRKLGGARGYVIIPDAERAP